MTQHILPEHEIEDQQILRRLGVVVAGFVVATAAMALVIGLIMG
jgi:Na+/H+-dicarboxylate symporter